MKKKPIRNRRRARPLRNQSAKAGMPWGTIVHLGEKFQSEAILSAVFYNDQTAEHKEIKDVAQCADYLKRDGITWINLAGIHNTRLIEDLGKHFGIHPLVLEDIANTGQRPKFDEFDKYIYITLKNLEYDKTENEIKYEQISIILGKNYVVSFQEKESPLFAPIRERLINCTSRARSRGADYLVYSLIDATVDSYYVVLENLEDYIEIMEDQVLEDASKKSLIDIQNAKRDLVVLLKSIFPLREAINKLQRSENPLINDSCHIFFNSIYDHAVHIIESVESQRDILSGLMDIYLTNVSNRMNSVMKVLTIIATIFIPITFFAGVYGMNFKNFPELEWKWGYALFWLVCIISVAVMLIFFRRKKWL